MKTNKYITFGIGVAFYLGSLSLFNNAYAHDHGERAPIKMLFKNLDLSDEQRKEVRSIMSESFKEGRTIRAEMREESMEAIDDLKDGAHERLSAVLSEEQMTQFNKNSQRMEKRKEKMRERKMKDHKKGKKRKDKERHKKHKKK
jgi:hypothetical protein|tara:strand:- start:2397 stop:2828 length:432 start_codon:yes stop_codon:yes gene_type:complete